MTSLPLQLVALGCCLQERVAVERPAPRGLAVRVVDERGAPMAKARVVVVEPVGREAWLDEEPWIELLRRGASWWTGDDGVALVEVASADVRVVAQSNDTTRWGIASVKARGGAPLELPIALEEELPIEVVEATGTPATSVELCLAACVDGFWEHALPDLPPPVLSFAFRSDYDGRAAIRPSDRFALAALAGFDDATWSDSWLRLSASSVGVAAERIVDANGSARLRVTLPETRRVEVELLDRAGELAAIDVIGEVRIARPVAIQLRGGHAGASTGKGGPPPRVYRLRFAAGRAVMARVAVDAEVSLIVERGARRWTSRRQIEEPADGVVRLRLREEAPKAALRLRLVDERGAPLADRVVDAELDCDGGDTPSLLARTDHDGNLLLLDEALRRELGDRRPLLEQIEFEVDDEPATVRSAVVSFDYPRTSGDLGEVVLATRSRPIGVAGQVVDERGEPLEGVTVTARVLGGPPLEHGRAKVTGADGAFAFHGVLAPTALLELELREAAFGTQVVRELAAGTLDARVELRRFGVVAGALRLDPGIPSVDFSINVAKRSALAYPSRGLARFELGALPPGRHDVAIWHHGVLGRELLETISDVDVPSARPAPDDRLEAIDLRGRLSITTFRIVDAAGEPISRGTLQFDEAAARAAEKAPDQSRFDSGRCTIITTRSLPEVTVRAPRFRSRRITPKRGENVVDLAPALPYSIRFDPKELPRDEAWQIDVDPSHEEPDEELVVARAEGAAAQTWLERGIFRPDEELPLLASAPGSAQIEFHVMHRDPVSRRWHCLVCATRSIRLPDRRDAPPIVLALNGAELDEVRSALRVARAAEEAARKAAETTPPAADDGERERR